MVDNGGKRKRNEIKNDDGVEDVEQNRADDVTERILNTDHVEDDGTVDQRADSVTH